MALFTKEFLRELEKEFGQNYSVIDYIIKSENLSFHDAILKLAKFCELKPEYIIVKGEKT